MSKSAAKRRYSTKGPILVCKGVLYYSLNDEAVFFEWIKKLKCIKQIGGVGDELLLYLRSRNVSSRCLRDLLALFFRYKVDMTQLQQFLNSSNAHWFNDQEYWFHRLVFGKTLKSRK